jgi:5'-3' exonuclease
VALAFGALAFVEPAGLLAVADADERGGVEDALQPAVVAAGAVRVLYPIKGVGSLQITDDTLLVEKYGVNGSQYVDFAVLRGDPSDGLPGVVGIGEKTATKLIAQYGDLAGIQAAAVDPHSGLTPAQRKRLIEGTAYLAVAPKVVSVATDIPLPAFDPVLPTEPLDPIALEDLAERWNLGTPLKRLLDTLATSR